MRTSQDGNWIHYEFSDEAKLEHLRPPMNHCNRCGADIYDSGVGQHNAWHARLEETAR